MNQYELLFIISTKATEDEREAIIEKVKGLLSVDGGSVANVDKWGVKKLAYPIKFRNDGFYVLMNLETNPAAVASVSKQMNIMENIIRYLFVKK